MERANGKGCTDRNCLYVFMADGGGIGGTHFHLTFAGLLDNVSLSAVYVA